jgi:hypothetical protein
MIRCLLVLIWTTVALGHHPVQEAKKADPVDDQLREVKEPALANSPLKKSMLGWQLYCHL